MKNIQPIFAATAAISRRKTTFRLIGQNRSFTVEAPGQLIELLMDVCNGKRTIKDITEALKASWDKTTLRALLNGLARHRILVDGGSICDAVWALVENPTGYPLTLSDSDKARLVEKSRKRHKQSSSVHSFKTLPADPIEALERRRSVRSFSGAVSLRSIVNMVWSAYGETADGRRTTPSAGALYPLLIHVALLHHAGNLKPGLYRVHLPSWRNVEFDLISEDLNGFARSFIDPLVFSDAMGVIIVSGSFGVTAAKYGTRSMLFVPLEAGHAAQNINIAAVHEKVATLEVGGFKEHILGPVLKLPRGYRPLITTVFGLEDTSVAASGPKIEVNWAVATPGDYFPPLAMASARMPGRKSWSHGRDPDPKIALAKAVAEAREWAACGSIPNLKKATISEIDTALDPECFLRFHRRQYKSKGFPFEPFDPHGVYEWAEACNEFTGRKAHILADLAYFPYFPGRPYYCYANSSGCAAHPSREKALETSVLELIERDSFMIAYLTRMPFSTIREQSLPHSIQARIRMLRQAGFNIWVKDHTLDLAPVMHVFGQSVEYGVTICSSCSNFDVEYAASHALTEVEACVVAKIQNGRATPIKPNEVVMPLDHEKLYAQKQYFKRADFLKDSRKSTPFKDVGKSATRTWQGLRDHFSAKNLGIYTVPLNLSEDRGGNGGLSILRSFIPGLVPMTFGYGQEPAGVERIYWMAHKFSGRRYSYKELTKFPHPFG